MNVPLVELSYILPSSYIIVLATVSIAGWAIFILFFKSLPIVIMPSTNFAVKNFSKWNMYLVVYLTTSINVNSIPSLSYLVTPYAIVCPNIMTLPSLILPSYPLISLKQGEFLMHPPEISLIQTLLFSLFIWR